MVEFTEIKEITPNIANQLQQKNINTVEVLAIQTLNHLKEILSGVSEEKIKKLQTEVWKKTGYWFTPATKLKEMRKDELFFSTGSKDLDGLLGGGIRSRVITEFAGDYATGKTECLLSALVENLGQHPEYTAIFFDTEETFSDVRVAGIAAARGYNGDEILERTIYTPIWHTQHFQEMILQADVILKARNVKLILVDSITASLRAEFVGREVLWHRQQLLNKILRMLLNYAKAFNLAVAVTNQVVANPQAFFSSDPVRQHPPVGGHIQAHNAETRVYFRRAGGTDRSRRIARLIDSSWLPEGERVFRITEKGIEDVEEKKPDS